MTKPVGKRPSMVWWILLLLIIAGAAVLVLPVSAADPASVANNPVVTIVAHGTGSYYLGEKVTFSGMNSGSDSTYLYITGPNLPATGAELTSPDKAAISGNPDTFTVAKTNADTTWEYSWYTAGLRLDAGSYTIYAASKPETEDQLAGTPYGTTYIIIKKPFISAGISPAPVLKGQPFTISGIAQGVPPNVQLWIFGDNYTFVTTTPVNSDGSFTFNANATLSGELPAGQDFLIVQHPMADNQFDIGVSGNYVRDFKQGNGTNLFTTSGPGSLQAGDAADALAAAFSARETHDDTYTNDTYTFIPFQLAGTGSSASTLPQVPVRAPPSQIVPIFWTWT